MLKSGSSKEWNKYILVKMGKHANCMAKIYSSSWKKVKIIFAVRLSPWQVDISGWINTASVGGSRRTASQDATVLSCPDFLSQHLNRQAGVCGETGRSLWWTLILSEKASRPAALAMESLCPIVKPQPMQFMVDGKTCRSWKLCSHRLQCLELLHLNCCVLWEPLKCGHEEEVTN